MNLRRLLCWLKHDWVHDTRLYQAKNHSQLLEWRTCSRCGRDEFNPTLYLGKNGDWYRGDKSAFLRAHPEQDAGRAARDQIVRSLLEE